MHMSHAERSQPYLTGFETGAVGKLLHLVHLD